MCDVEMVVGERRMLEWSGLRDEMVEGNEIVAVVGSDGDCAGVERMVAIIDIGIEFFYFC